MRYYHQTVQLISTAPLFTHDTIVEERQKYLKFLFGCTDYAFNYREETYIFDFQQEINNVFYCTIGKQKTAHALDREEHGKYTDKIVNSWGVIHIFCNITDDPIVGQRIRISMNQVKILRAFFHSFDKDVWSISVNSEVDEKGFWEVVDTKDIASLTISLVPKNIFKSENTLTEEMNTIQEIYNGTDADFIIKNPNGGMIIPKNSSIIKEALELSTKGGTRIILKDINKETTYDTDSKSVISTNVTIGEIELQGDPLPVAQTIKELFGENI